MVAGEPITRALIDTVLYRARDDASCPVNVLFMPFLGSCERKSMKHVSERRKAQKEKQWGTSYGL